MDLRLCCRSLTCQRRLRSIETCWDFNVVSDVPEDGRCNWVMLKRFDSELMLNTAYEDRCSPFGPEPTRISAHADTALFFDCEDVNVAYEYLLRRGVAVNSPVIKDYGMKQLYFKDPDGYDICLQHPVQQS